VDTHPSNDNLTDGSGTAEMSNDEKVNFQVFVCDSVYYIL
jgi:hypothetical protein